MTRTPVKYSEIKNIDFTSTYIYTDQPETCPKCNSRTEILLDLSHIKEQTQINKCLSNICQFEFAVQIDDIKKEEEWQKDKNFGQEMN